jgi:phosphate transport system protein
MAIIRKQFTKDLEDLNRDIADLGLRVEQIIADTIKALRTSDKELAMRIYREDPEINAAQNRIEQTCVNLIALQQPLARDLREITAVLKMITDVERVADQCADICEIMVTYPDFDRVPAPQTILNQYEKAGEMFAGSIDAFIRKDTDLAAAVVEKDDEVDALFSRAVLEMSKTIQEDQAKVPQATDYMFIAKYIERIGDHAVNIAEWTIYAVTGVHKSMNKQIIKSKTPDRTETE